MNQELQRAVQAVAQGGLVVYPTETLYALGANALNQQALERIVALKRRDAAKPLPVIIAGLDQLCMLSAWKEPALLRLIRDFWPGSLSILVPALPGLPGIIQGRHGFIAVRWTPHPLAQALARACGTPLAATSANISGRTAVSHPDDLDPELTKTVSMVVRSAPFPSGGLPSTLVRIIPPDHLEVLRQGAVSDQELQRKGWTVRTNI